MRSGGGREGEGEPGIRRISAAEPTQERSGNGLRQRGRSTQDFDAGEGGRAGEHSWLTRECAGCGRTTMRCICIQPAASVPAEPDDASAATASLGPAPAARAASEAAPVAAQLPSPPSPTDWNNRYTMCPVCHRPAAVCLCMRAAETRAADPQQRAAAAAEARAAAAALPPSGDGGILQSRASHEDSATREWMIPLEEPARTDEVRVPRPPPGRRRPSNALRAAGISSAADSTGRQAASESMGEVHAGRGGTRLTFRVRAPDTSSETSRREVSPIGGDSRGGGNLLGDLLLEAQRVAQERDGHSGQPGIEIRRGENVRSTLEPYDLVSSLDLDREAQANNGMNEKERAIHLANVEMAVAAARQEEAESVRNKLEKVEFKIPAEMLCPISSDIMREPVICADGHTYERATIAEWVTRKATSPLTNEPLAEPVLLIPNHALRSLITSFVEEHGGWASFA